MKHSPPWPAFRWLALAAVGAVALCGCRLLQDDKGLFVNPRDDYLDAAPGPPLELPEDMSDLTIRDALPIPEIVEQPVVKVFPDKAPRPAVLVGRDFDAVRIQRLGDKQWIVLGDPPAQVWPLTKQFLADSGVGVGREDAKAGVVDSAWLVVADEDYGDVVRAAIRAGVARHVSERGAAPPGRERLRFRVERGIRRGSTEVHVVHERAEGLGDDLAGAMPAVEAEVTAKLAEYYAAGVAASVSMVGRDIAAAAKAEIVKDGNGYPSLRLRVGFDRAWATVGQALQRAEIDAESNRDDAVYRAVFPAAGGGSWLRRLVPGGDDSKDAPIRIRVESDGDDTILRVSAPGGKPLTVDLAEEVLVTLREFAA